MEELSIDYNPVLMIIKLKECEYIKLERKACSTKDNFQNAIISIKNIILNYNKILTTQFQSPIFSILATVILLQVLQHGGLDLIAFLKMLL